MSLNISLFKGFLWNSLQQFGQLGIQLISIVVLARILTPEEYGIFGTILIFVSVSNMLTDSGISGYLIKKKNCVMDDYNTLFVYNLSVSLCLYTIIYLSASYIEEFYDIQNLALFIRISSLSILIQAISITQYTRLLKDLQFKFIAITNIFAGITSFITAYYLAINEYGIWSLISQQICFISIITIVYIIKNKNFPKIRFSITLFKEQFAFGINLLIANIIHSVSDNISNNFVAKIFNLRTAGFFSQASRLQVYPTSMLSVVVDKTFFPIFSKFNSSSNLFQYYIQTRRALYAAAFPLISAIVCFSHVIVSVVLGDKWLDITPILRLLLCTSYLMVTKLVVRNLLKSTGKTLSIAIIEFITFCILIIMFSLAFYYKSIYYIVLSIFISRTCAAILYIYVEHKVMQESMRCHIKDLVIFLIIALTPSYVIFLDVNLFVQILLFITTFGLSIIIFHHAGIKDYYKIISKLLNHAF